MGGRTGNDHSPQDDSLTARAAYQVDHVKYEVWYTVDARATAPKESDGGGSSGGEGDSGDRAKGRRTKAKKKKTAGKFEWDATVEFAGGDGVDISEKRRNSLRESREE